MFGGGRRVALEGPLGRVERGFYRLLRVDPAADQTWREYAMSMVVFSAVCTLTAYALLVVVLDFLPALALRPLAGELRAT